MKIEHSFSYSLNPDWSQSSLLILCRLCYSRAPGWTQPSILLLKPSNLSYSRNADRTQSSLALSTQIGPSRLSYSLNPGKPRSLPPKQIRVPLSLILQKPESNPAVSPNLKNPDRTKSYFLLPELRSYPTGTQIELNRLSYFQKNPDRTKPSLSYLRKVFYRYPNVNPLPWRVLCYVYIRLNDLVYSKTGQCEIFLTLVESMVTLIFQARVFETLTNSSET